MTLSFYEIDTFLERDNNYHVEKLYAFDRMVYQIQCKGKEKEEKYDVLTQFLKEDVKYIHRHSFELSFSKKYMDKDDETYILKQYLYKNQKLVELNVKEKSANYTTSNLRLKRKISFIEIDKILNRIMEETQYYEIYRYYYEDSAKYVLKLYHYQAEKTMQKIVKHLQVYLECTCSKEIHLGPIEKKYYQIMFEKKYLDQTDKQYIIAQCFEDEIKYQKIIL